MAISLGYFFTWLIKRKLVLKVSMFILIAACILLNIFQTIQFHHGVLNGDRMTKAYYCSVFGKMSVKEEDKKLLLIDRTFNGMESFTNEAEYSSKILKKLDFENSNDRDSAIRFSGKFSCKLDSLNIYSPAIEAAYSEITQKNHAWIRVSAYIYPINDVTNSPFCLVVHFNHNNYPYKYCTFDSNKMKLELNKWNRIEFNYLTPEVRNIKDFLKVYIWNIGKGTVYVDDLRVDIFEKIN